MKKQDYTAIITVNKPAANAVLFLATPAAVLITGIALMIDGGWPAI
jgi:NAD(P)-dependent dehydrogenase (short-subunit alcohol dehydrogenase family)